MLSKGPSAFHQLCVEGQGHSDEFPPKCLQERGPCFLQPVHRRRYLSCSNRSLSIKPCLRKERAVTSLASSDLRPLERQSLRPKRRLRRPPRARQALLEALRLRQAGGSRRETMLRRRGTRCRASRPGRATPATSLSQLGWRFWRFLWPRPPHR